MLVITTTPIPTTYAHRRACNTIMRTLTRPLRVVRPTEARLPQVKCRRGARLAVAATSYKLNVNKAVVRCTAATPCNVTQCTHPGQAARDTALQVWLCIIECVTHTSPSRQLIKLPPSALQGLAAKADPLLAGTHLTTTRCIKPPPSELGIKTVGDLGSFKYHKMAKTIATLAKVEEADKRADQNASNVNLALDAAHEQESFEAMLDLPPSALQGLTEKYVMPLLYHMYNRPFSGRTVPWQSCVCVPSATWQSGSMRCGQRPWWRRQSGRRQTSGTSNDNTSYTIG